MRVEVQPPTLSVVVRRGSDEIARVSLPYPAHGYGGHELLLSPDERYLVLWLHSGQSEVGYELFTFGTALAHVASFPYVLGEGYGPVFSDDARRLALAWATDPSLCLEEHELDDDGRTVAESVVEWARVHVRELDGSGERVARECSVHLRLPAGLPFEGDDSYYPELLEVTHDEVRFETVWGATVRAPLPLPENVVVPGPSRR